MDVETTGFDPWNDRLIEVGAVRCALTDDGVLTLGDRFATFVDPGRPIPAAVARLTGISDADLAGTPSPNEAAAALERFARGACLVGHNIGFDVAFLEAAGLPPGAERLDTAEMAAILRPTATSYALQRLAADAAIAPRAAHRALEDALTCASLLGALVLRLRALPPAVLEEARDYAP
ncbi:MAG: 3'-5' exonuclease, partial [Candidatus Limnocylindria bacterium]